MKNKAEYLLFISLSRLFKYLGLRRSRKFARCLGAFFFYFIPIRKQTVLENLRTAFPHFTEEQIKKTALENFKSISITLVEMLNLPWMKREELEAIVRCPSLNLVNEKQKENKGVILLSAHFGNWEYSCISIAAQLRTDFSVIVKSQRNSYVNDWINNVRVRWQNKVVPLGASIRSIYKELLDKKIVAMIADQRGPREGKRIDFFGRPTSIYPGPALLALKTGAPIIYGISVREPDGNYSMDLVEVSTEGLSGSEEDKAAEISRRHMAHLEKTIKEHPEQWLWHHKIWKY